MLLACVVFDFIFTSIFHSFHYNERDMSQPEETAISPVFTRRADFNSLPCLETSTGVQFPDSADDSIGADSDEQRDKLTQLEDISSRQIQAFSCRSGTLKVLLEQGDDSYSFTYNLRRKSSNGVLSNCLAESALIGITSILCELGKWQIVFPRNPRAYDVSQTELNGLIQPVLSRTCLRVRLLRVTVAPMAILSGSTHHHPIAVLGHPAVAQLHVQFVDHRRKRPQIKIENEAEEQEPEASPQPPPTKKRRRAASRRSL